jgi:hypothetical protein
LLSPFFPVSSFFFFVPYFFFIFFLLFGVLQVTAVLRRQKSKGRKTGGGLMGENDSDASQSMTLGPNDTGSRKNGDAMFLG